MTLRLLVADDNATMQKMVRLAFAGEDALVETASNGDAAIDMLKKFRPNVVLADISMSDYSGYEVCELIRQDPEFANIPVILMNGAFDSFDEEEAARVQASGYLTKPFDPSELITMVEKLRLKNTHYPATVFPENKTGETENQNTESAPDDFFHVTPRVCESYLDPNCILEIFNNGAFSRKTAAEWKIPDELIDRVAERVVEKMFPDIETLIRRTMNTNES